jgi:hypothetical protein
MQGARSARADVRLFLVIGDNFRDVLNLCFRIGVKTRAELQLTGNDLV